LATTARYLRIATSKVCSTSSPLDLLPHPISIGCGYFGTTLHGAGNRRR
jgi:hypothetical protein